MEPKKELHCTVQVVVQMVVLEEVQDLGVFDFGV